MALGVYGCAHKVGNAYPGNLYGVLEREEEAFVAALLGGKLKQVLAFVEYFAFSNGVGRVAYKHIAQGALSRTVGAHYGVYLARFHGEVYSFQYLLAVNCGMEVLDFQ